MSKFRFLAYLLTCTLATGCATSTPQVVRSVLTTPDKDVIFLAFEISGVVGHPENGLVIHLQTEMGGDDVKSDYMTPVMADNEGNVVWEYQIPDGYRTSYGAKTLSVKLDSTSQVVMVNMVIYNETSKRCFFMNIPKLMKHGTTTSSVGDDTWYEVYTTIEGKDFRTPYGHKCLRK